ncbi:MAG: nicotinate-nucleotide adenylyltransferase [Nitriliruptoraceae bacterium]
MPQRIGILGGTFDPPHLGHLVIAETARVALDLDHVRLMVAGNPWMKTPGSPAQRRWQMVQRALEGADGLVADDRELHRDGATYTIDTLIDLDGDYPDAQWFFIVGSDLVDQINQWHRANEVLQRVTLVVVGRPGGDATGRRHLSDVRRIDLPVPPIGISSTELRDRYQHGESTRYLVPLAVDTYIRTHGLYGAAHA